MNNPALDLEDSDDDAEWTPVKDTDGKIGRPRKRGDSSDEEEFSVNNAHKLKYKKRAFPDPEKVSNKRLSAEANAEPVNQTIVPDGDEYKVKIQTCMFHNFISSGWFIPYIEIGGFKLETFALES